LAVRVLRTSAKTSQEVDDLIDAAGIGWAAIPRREQKDLKLRRIRWHPDVVRYLATVGAAIQARR
jgi:hypothetical protein